MIQGPCPAGFYCEQGTTSPTTCTQTACLGGNKFDGDIAAACPARNYLSGTVCLFCAKGYICDGGGQVKTPVDPVADKGHECPVGHYCDPSISGLEIPCPASTYRLTKRGGSVSDCLKCPKNTYGISSGQAQCTPCGTGAESETG